MKLVARFFRPSAALLMPDDVTVLFVGVPGHPISGASYRDLYAIFNDDRLAARIGRSVNATALQMIAYYTKHLHLGVHKPNAGKGQAARTP